MWGLELAFYMAILRCTCKVIQNTVYVVVVYMYKWDAWSWWLAWLVVCNTTVGVHYFLLFF